MSIYLYETVFPDYRMALFEALKAKYGNQITLACGEEGFSKTLRTDRRAQSITSKLNNHYILFRQLLWQNGLLQNALNADIVIAEFSLRAVSTWLLLWLRSVKGRPTILWGHASGTHGYSKWIRRWMFARCNGFIAYMPREAAKLRAAFPNLTVWVAPNSFMHEADCHGLKKPSAEVIDVIYVGRLVGHKKVSLLLDGFLHAVKRGGLPAQTRLLLVGDGPERGLLSSKAKDLGMADRIVFYGHVSDVGALRKLYATALVSVSPGCVGLAATQSFGFGVPILVADNEPHGPEVELCRVNENAVFFAANETESLAAKLTSLFSERDAWLSRRERISSEMRASYTFEKMLEAFSTVIEAVSINSKKTGQNI